MLWESWMVSSSGQHFKLYGLREAYTNSISGMIQFSYANTQESHKTDTSVDLVYGRQLIFPVLVTVYQMLQCHSLHISPLAPVDVQSVTASDGTRQWSDIFRSVTANEWCLLSMHVSNDYNLPFEVTLSYQTGDYNMPLPLASFSILADFDDLSNSQVIPPGSTYRYRCFNYP